MATGSGQGLRKVNVVTGKCLSDTVFSCQDFNYFAIAKLGNDIFFTSNSSLYTGTLQGNSLQNCRVIDFTPVAMTSLTTDINGILYSANGNALYKWDPLSGNGFELIGNMPYSSAGDLIFYQGDLYMASVSGIVKVDINTPSLSTMFIPINSQSIYGMAVLSVDCNQNNVYAFETTVSGQATNMLELDMQNRVVKGIACVLPFGVSDAASDVEGGNFSGISLDEIIVQPQCKEPGKGMIKVIRTPGLAQYTYTLNGSAANNTGVFEHLDPGDYLVEVTTPGGCYLDTTVTVPLFDQPAPVVQVHQVNPDCSSGGRVWFTITPDQGQNKIIHNNKDTVSAAFEFSDLAEGPHHFSVVDQYYCELDAKDVIVSLEGSCDTVYFPSAFTPNNDGKNDLFRGSGNRSVKNYQLTVYNRWGQVVFATTNILNGWNGKVNETEQSAGIYVWVASYINKSGQLKSRKGTVVLLR